MRPVWSGRGGIALFQQKGAAVQPSADSSDPSLPGSVPPGSLPPGILPPGDAAPQPPRSSNRPLALILGSATVLTLVLCCVVLALTSFGGLRLFQSVQQESEQISAVLEQFMQAAVSKDALAARVLFLPENEVSEADLASLFRERADAFRSYERLKQTNFGINTNNDVTSATIKGTVVYADDRSSLPFEARLRKQEGLWYLISIRFGQGFGI